MSTEGFWISETWRRLGALEQLGRFRPRTVDIAITIAALVLMAGSDIAVRNPDVGTPGHTHWVSEMTVAVGVFVAGFALASVPLLVRRLYPVQVFAVTLIGAVAVEATPWHDSGADLGALIALGTVAAYRPLRDTIGFAAIFLLVSGLILVAEHQFDHWQDIIGQALGGIVVTAAAVGIGYAVAQRRQSRRAELTSAELRGREAVIEERARIARELHDVVAHGVSVMTIQAGGARMSFDSNPEAARSALEAIETTGRESLTEMRRLLGVLRGDDAEADDRPQPGIGDIAELVEQVRGAGLPVALTMNDHQTDISPGLALTIYRVVQESLTNVIKHAGPAEAHVTIQFDGGATTIDVTDNGRGRSPDAVPGYGLAGMRERVALYDGTVTTESPPRGGFRVHVVIPREGES